MFFHEGGELGYGLGLGVDFGGEEVLWCLGEGGFLQLEMGVLARGIFFVYAVNGVGSFL